MGNNQEGHNRRGTKKGFQPSKIIDMGTSAGRKKVTADTLNKKKPDHDVRVGGAGCATGEKAYSQAILLREAREKLGFKAK